MFVFNFSSILIKIISELFLSISECRKMVIEGPKPE